MPYEFFIAAWLTKFFRAGRGYSLPCQSTTAFWSGCSRSIFLLSGLKSRLGHVSLMHSRGFTLARTWMTVAEQLHRLQATENGGSFPCLTVASESECQNWGLPFVS